MTRIQRLGMFLEAHFGEVEYHMPEDEPEEDEVEQGESTSREPSFLIQLDEADARINLISMVRNSTHIKVLHSLTKAGSILDGGEQ